MKIAFGAHREDVYEVDEVGYLQLGHKPAEQLEAGEVGYVVANVRGFAKRGPGIPCSMRSIVRWSSSRAIATSNRWSSRDSILPMPSSMRSCGTPSRSYS